MIQTLFRNHTNIGTNNANGMNSDTLAVTGTGSQGLRKTVWPTSGVFNNLAVTLDAAPGVGNTITCTLREIAGNTALTVTISGTNTTGQLTGVDVNVTAGQIFDFIYTTTGAPSATIAGKLTLDFVPASGNKSCHTCNTGTQQTGFVGPFMMQENATLQYYQQQFVATPGDITALAAASCFAAVNANPLDFYINLNGVRQDGTGGTVDTKCSLISVSTNVAVIKTFTLPVVRGDRVYIESIETGTYSGNWTTVALEFTATNPGCSHISGAADNSPNAGTTTYNNLIDNDALSWSATVDGAFNARRIGGITPFQIKNLYLGVETDPGAAPNSRTWTARVNAADTGLTGVITTGVLSFDNTASAAVVQNNIMSMMHVPVSTPVVTGDYTWSIVLDTTNTSLISQVAVELISLAIQEPLISQVAIELISLIAIAAAEKSEFFMVD